MRLRENAEFGVRLEKYRVAVVAGNRIGCANVPACRCSGARGRSCQWRPRPACQDSHTAPPCDIGMPPDAASGFSAGRASAEVALLQDLMAAFCQGAVEPDSDAQACQEDEGSGGR